MSNYDIEAEIQSIAAWCENLKRRLDEIVPALRETLVPESDTTIGTLKGRIQILSQAVDINEGGDLRLAILDVVDRWREAGCPRLDTKEQRRMHDEVASTPEGSQYLRAKADFDRHAEGCLTCGYKGRSTHTLCAEGGKLHGVVFAFAQAYIGRPLPVPTAEIQQGLVQDLEAATVDRWAAACRRAHWHEDTDLRPWAQFVSDAKKNDDGSEVELWRTVARYAIECLDSDGEPEIALGVLGDKIGVTPRYPPGSCPGCGKVARHPGEGYVCTVHPNGPERP